MNYQCDFEDCKYETDYKSNLTKHTKKHIKKPLPDGNHLPVKGWENKYEIYDDGRVYSLKQQRFLKGTKRGGDYLGVRFFKTTTEFEDELIHRLVAIHFIPNSDNKPWVDHIDGNIRNNSASNLRWSTIGENRKNSRIPVNNSSGEKNVYQTKYNKYAVQFRFDGKIHYYGTYSTYDEAVEVAQKLREELYGEFHRHS